MTKINKYEALVLDFSGTIADDRSKVHSTMNDVLRHYGKPEIDFDNWKKRMSLDFKSMWEGFEVYAPLQEIQSVYGRFYPDNPGPFLIPGNLSALQELSQLLGVKNLHVLSGCEPDRLKQHMTELGLNLLFGRIIGGAHNKILGLKTYRGTRTLYVGDMESDAIAANEAELDFVALDNEYAYHGRNRLEIHHPRYFIQHLQDLKGIL